MRFAGTCRAVAAGLILVACEPAMNWRLVRPEGAPIVAMFPCRPATHVRDVSLSGATVRMSMVACTAGGATFALAFADVGDPARVDDALAALRQAAVANIGGVVEHDAGAAVPGMAPSAQARQVTLVGRLPSGSSARLSAVFFARGTVVFQATAVGESLSDDAVQTFAEGLRLSS